MESKASSARRFFVIKIPSRLNAWATRTLESKCGLATTDLVSTSIFSKLIQATKYGNSQFTINTE